MRLPVVIEGSRNQEPGPESRRGLNSALPWKGPHLTSNDKSGPAQLLNLPWTPRCSAPWLFRKVQMRSLVRFQPRVRL